MRVVVRCRATLYERDGAFQIYVNEMFPDGLGAAQLALEQLKARLEKEGLFDPTHKKPLPAYPKCIGVVTSKTGAALQDIRNVISLLRCRLRPAEKNSSVRCARSAQSLRSHRVRPNQTAHR